MNSSSTLTNNSTAIRTTTSAAISQPRKIQNSSQQEDRLRQWITEQEILRRREMELLAEERELLLLWRITNRINNLLVRQDEGKVQDLSWRQQNQKCLEHLFMTHYSRQYNKNYDDDDNDNEELHEVMSNHCDSCDVSKEEEPDNYASWTSRSPTSPPQSATMIDHRHYNSTWCSSVFSASSPHLFVDIDGDHRQYQDAEDEEIFTLEL